jgi:hypothetical protein
MFPFVAFPVFRSIIIRLFPKGKNKLQEKFGSEGVARGLFCAYFAPEKGTTGLP